MSHFNPALNPPIADAVDSKAKRRAKPCCHRHHEPKYDRPLVKIPILDRIKGKLAKFDWHKCKPMVELRRNGGSILMKVDKQGNKRFKSIPPRRLRIRAERESTLDCLLLAILNNVEYSYGARFLHECMLSIEELAKAIGQLHEYEPGYDVDEDGSSMYRHGRKSYDPVLGALYDLEAAKLIVVVREFDNENKVYKASRIFLTPLLFQSLGMTGKDTKTLMEQHKRYNKRHNKPRFKRSRPLTDKIANISHESLVSVLSYHRRWFEGELEPDAIAERNKELTKKFVKASAEQSDEQLLVQQYNALIAETPSFISFPLIQQVDKDNPGISDLERFRLIIDKLKH